MSGNLTATPRSALASRTACVVLGFHQERMTATVRTLLDAQEFRMESAGRTIAAIATHAAASVHVPPWRAALRTSRVLCQRRSPHDLALSAQHRGFDFESFTFARESFCFHASKRFLLALSHLGERQHATFVAAVGTIYGLLQPPDLFIALQTMHRPHLRQSAGVILCNLRRSSNAIHAPMCCANPVHCAHVRM